MPSFSFDHRDAAALQTLWTVRMLGHGYLAASSCQVMLAHQEEHVDGFVDACDDVFAELAFAAEAGDAAARIGGPVKHTGMQRLN